MPNDFSTGTIWSSSLPSWQRDYYSMLLLETLRTKSILVPYTIKKEDFAAANSGRVIYTEVYDTEPNWNGLSETDVWLSGAHMDSRTVAIDLEIHGDILKFSDYNQVVQYVKAGDMNGLVRNAIGQNQVDYLDLLAREAFLSHPYKNVLASGTLTPGGSRANILSTDLFDPDIAETIRVHLEENEVPGVAKVDDSEGPTIVCVTTPRVIKDIRTSATSKWLELQEYAGGGRKFNAEVGSWSGIRFVRTNRLAMKNYGAIVTQTQLSAATVAGQGAKQTVDGVYTVGQSNATRYVSVDSSASFQVGQYVTIHSAATGLQSPVETDGTQETRKIMQIDSGKLYFDKPLLKPHAEDDYVTNGANVHASIFMGGPGVVYGVGEAPNVILPPKFDDLMIVNRVGWRGFLKMKLFRPEYFEVVETAGSTD